MDKLDCRRGRGLARGDLAALCVSNACQRSTSLNQNAVSSALRAAEARRRHSSARRRNCSTLTLSSLRTGQSLFVGRKTPRSTNLIRINQLNFSRGVEDDVIPGVAVGDARVHSGRWQKLGAFAGSQRRALRLSRSGTGTIEAVRLRITNTGRSVLLSQIYWQNSSPCRSIMR